MAKKKAPKKPTKAELKKQAEKQKRQFNTAAKRLKSQNINLQQGVSSTTSVIELRRRGYSSKEIQAIANAFQRKGRPRSTTGGKPAKTMAEIRYTAETKGTSVRSEIANVTPSKPPRKGKKKNKKSKTPAAGKTIEATTRQSTRKPNAVVSRGVNERQLKAKARRAKTSKPSSRAKGSQRAASSPRRSR